MPKHVHKQLIIILLLIVLLLLWLFKVSAKSDAGSWFFRNATPQQIIKQQVPEKIVLDIPPISQFPELPTGCEITAVTMLLNYRDVNLSKTEVADNIPYVSDGNMEVGFWGNPYNDTGYTMYPPAWRNFFDQYLGGFTDLSNKPVSKLKATLKQKKPVVAWINYHKQPAHSVLLVGYDQNSFTFNDPYTGKRKQISFAKFWKIATPQGHRAMTY
ncbi:C39 family peptidase [Latilactobacillus graminis]|uniref:Peptidase C39-like domain-containing protein n=2 Tax=Latilactobacillus graminis TaxID=60519 RepID=A0AA89I0N0_9LACO|nr:C39 family peptidase [Latilactobacillus graminis]KRM22408.1 hypothetical protein FC90_GL001011 [Latilactobacillus graminis DSM 20719]QFP79421.1 C39 family peptidase [Latilactobacillus graminis]